MGLFKNKMLKTGDKCIANKDIVTTSCVIESGTKCEIVARDIILRTYDIIACNDDHKWITEVPTSDISPLP